MTDALNTRLYFLSHGLKIDDPTTLEAAVQQAVQKLSGIQAFSKYEVALLRKGGLNLAPEAGPDPLTETTAAFTSLLTESLGTAEAAVRLGVHITRIRQMLTTELTLYGFKIDGQWRIPCYQFTDCGLISNIGLVNAALNRALHPVAIHGWFTRPEPDLEVDGVAVSPLAWLKAGHSAETVRRIAAGL